MKKIFLITALFASYFSYGDANMALSVQTLPSVIYKDSFTVVKLSVFNNGDINLMTNSIEVYFTAPDNAQIIGIIPDSSATEFTLYSLTTEATGNTIRVVNTGGPINNGFNMYQVYVKMKGIVPSGANVGYTANIVFNPHNGPVVGQTYATQGNVQSSDDNASSGLTVNPYTPLPLNFTGINAVWNSNDAIVNWEVAREMDNEYFSVERSFDGKNFIQVGTVKSIGNHEETAKYNYADKGAKERTIDKVAYRVKQVDYNGKSTTSKIVWLINKGVKNNKAYVYPNPVTTNNTFAFVYENNEDGSGDLNINILDAHGKLVYTTTVPVVKGKNETSISVSTLAAGAYFVKYDNASLNINGTIRLIKD